MAAEVDPHDGVPLLLRHVGEHPVPQDAGIIDEDVEVTEGAHGLIDEALRTLPVRDVVVVGDRLATGGDDLVDDLLGGRRVGASPVRVAAEVVDDDLGALPGEKEGVLPTDASSRAGDDGDATLESVHESTPSVAIERQ